MHLELVQPLYRARKRREYTRISIDDTIRRCRGRRYLTAHTALSALCTEKGFTFSCPYFLDNIHLALVQPLYRARKSREYTWISIDDTIRCCRERRYLTAHTALSALCTEKGFTFSCPYFLDNIHLVLVQPLYRARKSRESTRISIDGTVRRCRGRRYWPARAALCAFCTEKGFTFLNS